MTVEKYDVDRGRSTFGNIFPKTEVEKFIEKIGDIIKRGKKGLSASKGNTKNREPGPKARRAAS